MGQLDFQIECDLPVFFMTSHSHTELYQCNFQKTNKIEHTILILKTIFASLVCE